MITKACNLTKEEVEELISGYGLDITEDINTAMERLSYLHKRLKAFDEVEIEQVTKQTPQEW